MLVDSSDRARIGVDLLRRYAELITTAMVSEPPVFGLDPEDGGRQIMKDLRPLFDPHFVQPWSRGRHVLSSTCVGIVKRLSDARRNPPAP